MYVYKYMSLIIVCTYHGIHLYVWSFFKTHHPARHEGKQAVKQHGVAKGLAIPLHLFHIITLLSPTGRVDGGTRAGFTKEWVNVSICLKLDLRQANFIWSLILLILSSISYCKYFRFNFDMHIAFTLSHILNVAFTVKITKKKTTTTPKSRKATFSTPVDLVDLIELVAPARLEGFLMSFKTRIWRNLWWKFQKKRICLAVLSGLGFPS